MTRSTQHIDLPRILRVCAAVALVAVCFGVAGNAGGQPAPAAAKAAGLNVILGRPTGTSITLSVLSDEAVTVRVEYGTAGRFDAQSTQTAVRKGEPVEIALTGLAPDTGYSYRVCVRREGEEKFTPGVESGFHTQRAPGATFTFEVQGDSHPERPHEFSPALYTQMLRSVAADRPDFHLMLGDDFSVDALRNVTPQAVESIYLNQRRWLSAVGCCAPIFLVNGNHEQAALCNLNGTPDNVAVWAQRSRNRYFPEPAPDGFYTGDAQEVEHIGLLRDYYAWTWGDALFVVIDPYWHSDKAVDTVFGGGRKTRDLWTSTLGEAQYRWFKQTLEESRAKYKFVFAHHVLGTGRGGVEWADSYEWGGKNRAGVDEFAQKRPGWAMPIHALMAKNGVTIFFQGHDHIFVRQEKDGVVYQSMPEPADPNYALHNREAYRTGEALPSSGRVRVIVGPEKARVEYVRSWLPKDATAQHPDGEVAFAYEVRAREDRKADGR